MTVLFCRSLGHGGAGTSPGSTLHAYPITRQARCQAPAALLLARRDTIERSGRTRTPSLSFEGCKRAPGVVAQRPPPPKRARADKAGTDDDPRGGVRPRGSRSRNTRHRAETCTPVPAAADTHPARAHCARAIEAAHCAAGASAERERERQKGRHQRPPPSPAPWRSGHQEPPATAPFPGNVGACQPPPAPAERRRSGEQPRRAEGIARSENSAAADGSSDEVGSSST